MSNYSKIYCRGGRSCFHVLADIQSGDFADTFRGDYAKDFAWFKKQRDADHNHPVEKIGKELRRMMPWLKPVEV